MQIGGQVLSRRRVIIVTGALCLVAAVLGLAAGQRGMPSETQVIEAGAAIYVSETSGLATDCVGLPGEGDVWISVICGDGEDRRTYLFDRRGGRIASAEEPKA